MSIESKEIKGINIRLLLQYTGVVAAAVYVYVDLKNTSLRNREIMQEYRAEAKDQYKMHEANMKYLEQQQRLIDLRLTVLETQIKTKTE